MIVIIQFCRLQRRQNIIAWLRLKQANAELVITYSGAG
jgi:hypothetical protein